MDTILFLLITAYAAGVASRPNLETLWNKFYPVQKPGRITRFDTLSPAPVIEPSHRFPMWVTYMHAYIMRGEICKRKPLNVNEMTALTGLGWRDQAIYKNILVSGGVIDVVGKGGVRWLVGKGMRRKKLIRLPYPTDYDPPQFTLNG